MFCPNCGSENHTEKNYCRRCGLPLAAVRLAMDGRVDEAIKTTEGDKKLIGYRFSVGLARFLMLVAIATIFTAGKIGFSNLPSAALILIMMMVYFIYTSRKLHRVARLLDEDQQTPSLKLTDGLPVRELSDADVAPGSITEQSTLELKSGDRIVR